jgi:glutaredoxin
LKVGQITVWGRQSCHYSDKTIDILKKHNIEYKVFNIEELHNQLDVLYSLISLTGMRALPSIFIGSRHIGTYNDLAGLVVSGDFE